MLGSVGQNAEDLIDSSQGVADLLTQAGGASVVDSFYASVLTLMALIATGYTISSGLRLRAEESAGHVETLLAAPVGRRRWAISYVIMAMAGSAIVLVTVGLGIGLAAWVSGADAGQIPQLVGAALVQLPAVWVLGAIVVALFGVIPRATTAAWAALGACVLLWLLGSTARRPILATGRLPLRACPCPAGELPGGWSSARADRYSDRAHRRWAERQSPAPPSVTGAGTAAARTW